LNVGFGAEVAASITTELFKYLDAPVQRAASKNVPVGFAKSLEAAILLNEEDIVSAIRSVIVF
jgi:2-oxoisovalerate dehydrogenase E1 component